ncbi:MAG TPA: DNA/RNA nuclease SfsA [Clostridiaceae bacterium]|nr:DNA/RNA nuclease SfsA [Clostridiaceae bacterium]
MKYKNVKEAKFIFRPNRFLANIEINGKSELCRVKNTGRCKELLIPGTKIYVQETDNQLRKTKYDLITVCKGNRLVNIDSQAPNKVFYDWVCESNYFDEIVLIKPESRYGNSRFDFYIETSSRKLFAEVKGVTLEEEGVVLFPDAPTERGIKHINELCQCMKDGYEAYMVFIVQMENVLYFTPNRKTHKAFGDALREAEKAGLHILALDCKVTEDSIVAKDFVNVRI